MLPRDGRYQTSPLMNRMGRQRRYRAERIFDKMKTLLAGTSDPSLLQREHVTFVVFRYPPGCLCQ